MATNPMQKKARNAFLLGMVVTLVIAALIVFLLYTKIDQQQKELQTIQKNRTAVCVLNQEVKSGQLLTDNMFTLTEMPNTAIPSGATNDIKKTLSSYSLSDQQGRPIYFHPGSGNGEDTNYYYYLINGKESKIYIENNGSEQVATSLKASDTAYYYAGDNRTQKTEVSVTENAVVAKVDMNTNTIITGSLIARSDELTTNDLRKEEYNVISLPVDLAPDEYIDVRFVLPNGQNYIVVSKKKVTIPMSNGQYLPDTIQMNLTEEEILKMSCAIVENFKTAGSKLYASRYTEAGMQQSATTTYQPNDYVINLVRNDPNVVKSAIKNLTQRTIKDIDRAVNEFGNNDNVTTKMQESTTATQEERKNYLQTIQ